MSNGRAPTLQTLPVQRPRAEGSPERDGPGMEADRVQLGWEEAKAAEGR